MENKIGRNGKKGIVIAIIVILIFAGFIGFNYVRFISQKKAGVEKTEKIPVQVTESKIMNMQDILEQTGDIRPMLEVNVYPKVPGKIIERLPVEKGDLVKRGSLIATLENKTIKAQIEEAEAALELAKTNLEVIEKDYIRLENLYKEKALARQKLDHIKAERKSAKARIKRANAVLDQLEILYKNHRIYAPVSGYVSARYVDRGNMSSVAQPIIRISSEKRVKVITTVTEKDFPHVRKGMECEIAVDAFPDKVFRGNVAIINPTLDPATRTGEIEIHISNNRKLLRSGMFAHVKLYLGEKSALVVERDVLNKLPGTGNYYVYVVRKDKVVLKNVKIGLAQGNYVEITKGFTEGEQVVIKGQNRLRDGVLVTVEQGSREGNR
jgi:HlyD family secretion protein